MRRADDVHHEVDFRKFVIEERFPGDGGDTAAKTRVVSTDVASLCLAGMEAPGCLMEAFGVRDDPSIDMTGAWSEAQTWVGFYGEEACAFADEFHRAIQIGDLALWVGIKMITPIVVTASFWRSPLVFRELCGHAAASRFADSDPKAAQAFASCRLTPTWSVDLPEQNGRSLKTKYRLVFYLDHTTAAASGWFTTEDLDDWIHGGGAVLA